jgi:hypothetical protein
LYFCAMPAAAKMSFSSFRFVSVMFTTKDFIAPSSFKFGEGRYFAMGKKTGAVSFLEILAPELNDRILADMLDLETGVIVNLHIKSIDRINKEIAKTREKITEYQNKLKGLEAQKTEAENLEIVQLVRAMRLTPQELNAMLSGGGIPGMNAAPATEAADYEEQEDNADEK